MPQFPQFQAIADHAVLVSFADAISAQAHETVVALDRALAADMPHGATETVPALVNLLIAFDPLVTDHEAVSDHVRTLLDDLSTATVAGQDRQVMVCYEAPFSPDLAAVAKATGLTEEAVINAHLSGNFHVLMYGFAPGYAYLAGTPEAIQVPRKPAAVRDVPAGSVIIAGPQCLITTLTMPTGWSIIGRSPTRVLTGDPVRPFLFDVGDRVVFKRIDAATFAQMERSNG